MSGLSALSSASGAMGHFAQASNGRAAQSSGLKSGSSAGGTSASGDTTTTTTNANGSLTTTTVNAAGQIVSTATSQPPNQAAIASNFATQANADILQGQMPASLLNMVV